MKTLDTEQLSRKYRAKAINLEERKISITNYNGTLQEKDLSEPANCEGFGRIRHFKLKREIGWPENPLPIVPAATHLGIDQPKQLSAQVFQNSVCNWRCWYCYVDFKLLNGDERYSKMLSCEELLNLYLAEHDRPLMIDLSGGQPDLTPEWVVWMMEALEQKNLENKIFLWSDDNLSNDYFWKFLSPEQISKIQGYKNYARVVCFKGIDQNSFNINTSAEPALFRQQFELFKRLRELNLEMYAYITLTAPLTTDFDRVIPSFLDEIQKIDSSFPLKIIPLKIYQFSPSVIRTGVDQQNLLVGQQKAIEIWEREMNLRFSANQRQKAVNEK